MTDTDDEAQHSTRRSLADCIEPSDPFEPGRLRVRQPYAQAVPPSHDKPPQRQPECR